MTEQLLATTYDVTMPTGVFTFKKATVRKKLQWDDAARLIGAPLPDAVSPPLRRWLEAQGLPESADLTDAVAFYAELPDELLDEAPGGLKHKTEADIIRVILPLIDEHLLTVDGKDADEDVALELTYHELCVLFKGMQAGADCSYAAKKDSGSPSPCDGEQSTLTEKTTP